MTTTRERLGRVLGPLVSAAAVAAIVLWASRQPAPQLPSAAADIAKLAAALATYALATLVRAWRWHEILRLDGIEHRRADALGLTVVGYMGNTVLPARGGEVLRVVFMSQRSSARKWEVFGSILAERLLDAAVLAVLFALLTWTGVAGAPAGQLPAIAAAAGVALGLIAVAVYLRARIRGRLQGFADRVRPAVRAVRPLFRPVGGVLVVATALVWGLEGVVFALVAASLGLDMTVVEGLFVDVVASFFALIPAAPGYVGTLDAAMLFGLHALDIRGGVALSFVILVRFVLFVPITVAGGALIATRYGGLAQLRRARESGEARPSGEAREEASA